MILSLGILGAIVPRSPGQVAVSPPKTEPHTPNKKPLASGEMDSPIESPAKVWVYFQNKGNGDHSARQAAVLQLERSYNPRAIKRRKLRRTREGLFDTDDLPLNPMYTRAVLATGAEKRIESRWLNAISVNATARQIRRIARLPFVRSVDPVRTGRRIQPKDVNRDVNRDVNNEASRQEAASGFFYGSSFGHLLQMNLISLHDSGFTGQGIVIGMLDTGFKVTHDAFNHVDNPLQVVAQWDFVNNDAVVANEPGDRTDSHNHGTWTLGTIAAYAPNSYVGAATDATFILCKTEDVTQEVEAEEDYYVAGLEFIEANGADIATSSLGYIDWYTQDDLDGLTAVTTIATNIAIANGLICCTSAGNSGNDLDPEISHLIAPADGFGIITVGAVDSLGTIAPFSSDGPTAGLSPLDRRIKPEVLAHGVNTQTVSVFNDTGYSALSGTSFSAPLVAGAMACLLQARPTWTVSQMRNYLFQSAGDFVANAAADPLYVRGYGIINAYRAARTPCPADSNFSGIVDVEDLLDLLGDWGDCGSPEVACQGDVDYTGLVDVEDLLILLGQWGACP